MTKNRRDTYKLLRALLLLIGIQTALICVMMLVGKTRTVNMLAYSIHQDSHPSELVLFDAQHRLHFAPFTHIAQYYGFGLSPDGRVALLLQREQRRDLVVWNMGSPYSPQTTIGRGLAIYSPPIWSRDGRYLAFRVESADGDQLYVWDGETTHNITPDIESPLIFSWTMAWSYDGRLAFEVLLENNEHEIYLWDGYNTVNFSQNRDSNDRWPVWNHDGRLAFLSWQPGTGDENILVWDGVTTVNGLPDRDSFINVAPDYSVSHPTWTNTGLLAFRGYLSTDLNLNRDRQTFVWDGQSVTKFGVPSDYAITLPTWSADGRWAFDVVTNIATWMVVTVRDVDNRTLLTAQYSSNPVWSVGGYLMFCRYIDPTGWSLSLWNGQEPFTVAEGGYDIFAQWQSGARIVCSNN